MTARDPDYYAKHVRESGSKSQETLLKKAALNNFNAPSLSASEIKGLEAIVLEFGRPALLIKKNRVDLGQAEALWQQRLSPFEDDIANNIPSVGRIELRGLDGLIEVEETGEFHLGTGFVVGDGLILTNRHVAEVFCNPDGSLKAGFRPVIDFVQEFDRDTDKEFEILRGIEIGEPNGFDFAILQVDTSPGLPPALEIGTQEDLDDAGDFPFVYTNGYPGVSDNQPPAAMDRYFGGIFSVKRCSPGRLNTETSDFDDELRSDYTSLGGSSGGPVHLLDSGLVIGLHFAGSVGVTNHAVPIWRIHDRIEAAKNRVSESNVAGRASSGHFMRTSQVHPPESIESLVELFAQQNRILERALAGLPRASVIVEAPAGVTPLQSLDEVSQLISAVFHRARSSFGPSTALVGSPPAIANSATTMEIFTVNRVSPIFGITPPLVYKASSGFQTVAELAASVHQKRTVA